MNKLFGKSQADYSPNFQTLIRQSMEELQLKTAAHDSAWHLGEASWSVDQAAGIIVFTSPQGITATCPVQIIGTYNSSDSTFLWGWEHPSVAPALQTHANKVRAYGVEQGIVELTTQKVNCTEVEAWAYTALACKLMEAQGAYRGRAGTTFVFLTFGAVRLNKEQTDA